MREGQHKKNLTDSECNNMVQHLMTRCTGVGKLRTGAAKEIAPLFDCTPTTDVRQRKKGRCGRKHLHTDLAKRIQAIPQSRRYCFRTTASALGLPTSTLHRYFKRGVLAKYSSSLKPALTDSNKICRLNWALKKVMDVDGEKYFDPMYDTVHVDEKWFFMTRLQTKVIGAPGERIKQRTCKSKRHLLKVMFLSAVARPRWDESKQE
ncbi:hypothetical protein DYB32_010568, partial [Aphanomyces invadans]